MKQELETHGAEAVIIGSGVKALGHAAVRLLRSPWPVLYDPDRSVYRAWGLEKKLGLIQRSGSFVVDGEGVVRFACAATNPAAALPKRRILEVVRGLSETGD